VDDESGSAGNKVTTFTSLKNPHYRWFWLGMFISFTAINLQVVARNWLVYEMTDSQRDVGWVAFAYGLPILFLSLYGGAMAERVSKRTLLIWTLFGNGIVTLVIAILIATGDIQLWHLIVAAAVSGVLFAFHVPARFAIIPELVQEREYLNAVALNSTGWNLSVLLSSVGALLLPVIDVGGIFWITVAAFFISTGLLLMLPVVGSVRQEAQTSILLDLIEGLKYIHHNIALRSLLAVAFIVITFGLPYMNLMPPQRSGIRRISSVTPSRVARGFQEKGRCCDGAGIFLRNRSYIIRRFRQLLFSACLPRRRRKRQRRLLCAEQYADADHSSFHHVRAGNGCICHNAVVYVAGDAAFKLRC
jgi:MFS family permease